MTTTLDQAFDAFVAGIEERGPTVRELADALGHPSSHTGHYWMHRMVEAGLVEPHGYGFRLTAQGRLRARLRVITAERAS